MQIKEIKGNEFRVVGRKAWNTTLIERSLFCIGLYCDGNKAYCWRYARVLRQEDGYNVARKSTCLGGMGEKRRLFVNGHKRASFLVVQALRLCTLIAILTTPPLAGPSLPLLPPPFCILVNVFPNGCNYYHL